MKKLFLLFFIILKPVFGEELVIIKAVSTSGQTFAIDRGSDQNISQSQTSLFTNNDASFKAHAIAVDRNYSLWEISDPTGRVPFKKDEFVNFSNSLENIWTQIPKTALFDKKELGFNPHDLWIIRAHYTYAISESISDTSSDQYAGRTGFQVEALFGRRTSASWEFAGGIRYDREVSTLENPSLTVPTQRMMVTGESSYHFYHFASSQNSLYLSFAFAYGISNTTIDDTSSSGTALVLPIVKLGMIYKKSTKYTWVFEGSFESIDSTESFEDQSTQSATVTNTKFGVGLRF